MHSFESDYTAGARVEILRRLNETNLEQLPGYGSQPHRGGRMAACADAAEGAAHSGRPVGPDAPKGASGAEAKPAGVGSGEPEPGRRAGAGLRAGSGF